MNWTRRQWIGFPLAGAMMARTTEREHVFSYDHILGTSLDFAVRGASEAEATRLNALVLEEVESLRRVLSTYDSQSEISRLDRAGKLDQGSAPIREVLALYRQWEQASSGVLNVRAGGRLNIDALGKAYILDRVMAKLTATSKAEALLLNIGGDLVARGAWEIGIEDPRRGYDNVAPALTVKIENEAIATSGTAHRGAHLIDGRTGLAAARLSGASIAAKDAVTANALSTWMCITGSAPLERFAARQFQAPRLVNASAAGWAKDFEVSIKLTLKSPEGGFRVRRPYIAVWAEDESGKVIKNIAVWADRPRWLPDLYSWYKANGSGRELYSLAKATRGAGQYKLVWDGLDEKGQPVPAGNYKIWVESNREHGTYAKESAVIACAAKEAMVTSKGNSEFEAVEIKYGPKGVMA